MFRPGTQSLPQAPQGEWRIPPTPPRREVILETVGLTKAYGKRVAVNGLNLEVLRGEVFGFLGPNGAGKTTTIRMLLNLIAPTSGEVRLFGQPLVTHAGKLLPYVGALIEQPSFQSYLSGRDNLVAAGGYTGGVPASRIDEVLEIVEMRELMRKLSQQGKTIFVSSHILAEVRQVCTRIGIIRGGQLIGAGAVAVLLRATSRWEVEVENPEQVCRLLSGVPIISSLAIENGIVVIKAPTMRGRDLLQFLAKNGIWPESVKRSEEDLENIFLRLTEKEAGL